jgi:aspartate carbamoyltransferase catalytic subunit
MPHLIDIKNLSSQDIINILNKADDFIVKSKDDAQISYRKSDILKHKTVFNLFYEPSTRTRTSFELAAKNLSATVINLDVANSSVKKGESLKDTILTISAMQADAIIVRHSENNTAEFISEICGNQTTVINAGDGRNAHPTQALLDLYTIRQHKPNIKNLKVAIIGDVLHSRVARSLITALKKLECANINIIAPDSLLPDPPNYFGDHVFIHNDLKSGLMDADVIVCLRLQKERMHYTLILDEQDFFQKYGITTESLKYAKPNAIVLHPGPINRNVEISSEVADGKQSVILEQVSNGVAIRMAILALYV